MNLAIAMGAALESRPRPLTELFDATVLAYPDRPAIDFMGRVIRYADLAESVRRAAAGLRALGVGSGTRVALCMPNMPHYPILFLATLRLGGVVVNVNPLYVERELHHLLEDSGAEIIATCDLTEIHARVSSVATALGVRHVITCPIAEELPALKRIAYRLFRRADIAPKPADPRHITFRALLAAGREFTPPTVAPDAVAVLQYTGGTTGLPKAAMLSHANLVANADAMVAYVGGENPSQDRVIGALPLFHVFALTTVLSFSIRVGAQMILLPRFELEGMLATIARTRPTFLPAVPTIFGAVASVAAKRTVNLSGVRACISGGAPLPAEVREAFTRATGARLVEGYGLSEASPIITCNPIDGVDKPGSAGLPFPGTTIEIRDLTDPGKIVSQGERGEICARGPQVMAGYWRRDEATREVFVDGALRTGDVGYLDDGGYLFIVDRIKDVIISGGYNVYPRVIEDALYEHPAVAEAVVIGVDDSYRGQAAKAFVTLKPGPAPTPAELRAFLGDKVSKIELPREIEIRDTLPKTLIGKLSKKELIAESKMNAPSLPPDPGGS
ncbi:long-chain fatty acid--CoA ligase [uncultured Sphingomonas sp.]|uniref:long-chain-fatty-acid--CoA ligase n=1 Tax=uncultured Sphingomonas sp. TaxID=158754 RepID=UPI0026019084|nr:long-chain fatty acid--CoA ligase [uncultured Sphingomonas sp.]